MGQSADLGDLRVYSRGPEGALLPDDTPFALDVRTLSAHQDDPDHATSSAIRIDADALTVRLSLLNEDPVYYAADRMRGLFAYFTNLMLAPLSPEDRSPLVVLPPLRTGGIVARCTEGKSPPIGRMVMLTLQPPDL
ncbi:hypothetical protein [Streptomyces sp. NPDC051776]|uniref:hypothetical protein n=1 Tax=Streptomyces sp. NPDC051776 TaxID=3155414 RepID=UPI003445E21B